jgi:UDP-GlcNAc3NAcA epimerase
MKVLSVVGNRPQFIKSAPLSLALRTAGIDEVVLHTGQHYDDQLSQVFFDELELPEPKYRLDLRTAEVATIEPEVAKSVGRERPDWVIVYGDTNSTLAGARAAIGSDVPVAHVEAGLRSGDLTMPEEQNRIEVDRIAALLLAPDERSRAILESESVRGRVAVTGDVMRDALDLFAPIARRRSDVLQRFGVQPGRFVLVTVHREANVRAERLRRIVEGLNRVTDRIVFPAHPRTRAAIDGAGPRRFEISARVSGLLGARLPGAGDRDGLGWATEGGVLVRRTVRDDAAVDRMGGHGARGRERARRRRSRSDRERNCRCLVPRRKPDPVRRRPRRAEDC